ncbi:MAG: phosphoglycerate dehydrogenase [Acidaminococcaceae bacterium]|jgi:D-3-phosphoglycerate dehydrogenase|nr:phosphoglycerate dehydrogenase [Acidaminococcaceae bacterium]MCI2110539.1 phosphoglycerate dehydrogenase [Acidaminococcaceae bacterium]
MKVIVTERISDKGVELLKAEKGLDVDVCFDIPRDELLKVIGKYDAVIVRSVTKVNEEFFKHATNLKVVGRAGNGVDNIELEPATKRGVIVVNTPESNVISAAEHTIGLMLASARNTVRAHKMIESRVWERKDLKGTELFQKTLGIIGLGRIGTLVTKRMQAFGMTVIAYDPYIPDARFRQLGVEKCETLDELLEKSDVITIHTPKTEETINMVGAAELAKCKKGVRLVNCARGGLYNEQAVADAIKSGQVASLGLDVLADEPKAISPLIDLPQCVLTPHLGADTLEAQDKVGIAIAKEVINALHGEMVPNAVNLPALHPQEMEGMLKYLELGEALGKLYYQMEKAPVEKIEIIYEGAVADMETSLITRAVLKGVFEPVLKERINVVNAELATKSRGVEVVEGKNNDKDKNNKILVNIYAGKKVFNVAGTVLSNGLVRITEIDGYDFDLTPAHYMIVVRNEDKPGMIGQIGTLLGAAHVNIATMQVSRTQIKGTAMMFMTVDNEVDKETIKLITGIDGITASYFVKL